MTWVVAVLLVLVLGAVALLAAGPGGTLEAPERDRVRSALSHEGPLTGTDLRRVRFPMALRGYRMTEVDALLDRLAAQLEGQQDEGRERSTEDG